jgi:hypothetical protein
MPSGENVWNELLKTMRPKAKGSLVALQVKLWRGIRAAELGMNKAMAENDSDEVRRWLHVMQQLAGVYIKTVVDADIELRLGQLEKRFSDTKPYTANGAARNGGW